MCASNSRLHIIPTYPVTLHQLHAIRNWATQLTSADTFLLRMLWESWDGAMNSNFSADIKLNSLASVSSFSSPLQILFAYVPFNWVPSIPMVLWESSRLLLGCFFHAQHYQPGLAPSTFAITVSCTTEGRDSWNTLGRISCANSCNLCV